MRGLRLAALRFPTIALAVALLPAVPATLGQTKPEVKPELPQPRRLGRGVELRRDPVTGELRTLPAKSAKPRSADEASAPRLPPATIRARVGLVEVSCNVFGPDGVPLRGLGRDDFRLFEDGVQQSIAHFDESSEPASIALLIDASPSVFREWDEMKVAARALVEKFSPRDAVAVVAFAGGAHLLLPFSRDRVLLERAMVSRELARVADSRESNIYQAVYLTVRELFRGPAPRRGRKAIILLTDGQDSGLGLSWDPASAAPQPGERSSRLTFEDVVRELAAAGVEVYAVSTQARPKAMTDVWLEAHRSELLVTPAARELGMPHYTLYLAELVRRSSGRLYFLREIGTLSEVYRRIAETLGAQYTLGYYPTTGLGKPGWHALRVELAGHDKTRLTHRAAYYVPAAP